MIIDVIVEIETIVGETVVMTTTAVATETAIEIIPGDSAPGRVAIAGRSGGGMIVVDTFATLERIGESCDSSGVEGGKRGRSEPQRHKDTKGEIAFQSLPLFLSEYLISDIAKRERRHSRSIFGLNYSVTHLN